MAPDFNNLLKKISDGIVMGFNKHGILMAFKFGESFEAVSIAPEDVKQAIAGLNETVRLYEAQFGPIPDAHKPTPSPIDLSSNQ